MSVEFVFDTYQGGCQRVDFLVIFTCFYEHCTILLTSVWHGQLLYKNAYTHVCVGPYMIVCKYGRFAAGCNQEPVQAVVAQIVSRYSGFPNVVGNDKNPGGPIVGGA